MKTIKKILLIFQLVVLLFTMNGCNEASKEKTIPKLHKKNTFSKSAGTCACEYDPFLINCSLDCIHQFMGSSTGSRTAVIHWTGCYNSDYNEYVVPSNCNGPFDQDCNVLVCYGQTPAYAPPQEYCYLNFQVDCSPGVLWKGATVPSPCLPCVLGAPGQICWRMKASCVDTKAGSTTTHTMQLSTNSPDLDQTTIDNAFSYVTGDPTATFCCSKIVNSFKYTFCCTGDITW